MQSFQIGSNEAGQRFDKFLHKLLPEAQNSFLYKMLRKKNITLNGKKAEGKEILVLGDQVSFFFSEETYAKFAGKTLSTSTGAITSAYELAYKSLKDINVIYEDAHVLILNKPAGILTQKASDTDLSLNEWLIGYMLANKQITPIELNTFHPSVCNRLDRNTSGLVLCGKSLLGSQALSEMIKERTIRKFYRTLVKGKMTEKETIKGYLHKDEKTNRVTVSKNATSSDMEYIETAYEPLQALLDITQKEMTYLEVELITGKTHQIRAHLASIGCPLLGDYKYGNKKWNDLYKERMKISAQLLHAYRVEFPSLQGEMSGLSGQSFIAPLPPTLIKCLKSK